MSKVTAPYGSWKSPITSAYLTSAGIGLGQLEVGHQSVYWCEGRPMEAGRVVVVRRDSKGNSADVTPAGFNSRTRVHEYGGGAYTIHGDSVFFSNFADQRMYRQDGTSPPVPITPDPPFAASLRYADARTTPDGQTLVCVRERHESEGEPANELVAFPADGSKEPRVIASGHSFYAAPRFNPDGSQLCWITWDHPNMPWDGSELWTAHFNSSDGLSNTRWVAGGASESIVHPDWSPEGVLHFVSDRSGWWNLYSERRSWIAPVVAMDAEFGIPHWVFGVPRYAFLSEESIACIYSRQGMDHLAVVSFDGTMKTFETPYTSFADLRSNGVDQLFVIAASASIPPEVISLDVGSARRGVLKSSMSVELDAADISVPEPIEFPTTQGRTAFALYYPPTNKNYSGPADEKPLLLVMSHGGPTSSAGSALKLPTQYWTSRGFAVVDVNYGGSTGYGREYRERLNGTWGIVDVDDCIHAARFLAGRGDVDPKRMAIRGGSAGGFTTLSALVFHDVFSAGASHYGVADLAALATDTHKFESRYLDRLVGPYPEAEKLYRERSPIHFADRLSCPVILLQGLEDKVVPPNQAETFVEALRAKRLPFAYVVFPAEGHGFRQGPNIQRAAEAELYFYSRVFGFKPADDIVPVEIENLG
ncbi:MAG TPA: S9 family peptidase [Terriglobia bacterium]|nr:S9 family peptidase [Terriglobia bacterium]